MRVLVCGGRYYSNYTELDAQLSMINAHSNHNPITTIIEGGATGADHLARQWAFEHKIEVLSFPANWAAYGRAAGPIRNKVMLVQGKPDLVVAFPGGQGTKGMIRLAHDAKVKIFAPGMYNGEHSAIVISTW